MLEKTHERVNRLCDLSSLHGLPEQRCKLKSPRLQQAKHATSETLGQLKLVCFKCSDTNVVFQTGLFLILFVRNTKGPQALTAKPATVFPEIVYITVISELRFC